jgi:hypothetical protein
MRGDALLHAEPVPAPLAGVWIVIDDLIELVLQREPATRAAMTVLAARLAQHLLGLGPSPPRGAADALPVDPATDALSY